MQNNVLPTVKKKILVINLCLTKFIDMHYFLSLSSSRFCKQARYYFFDNIKKCFSFHYNHTYILLMFGNIKKCFSFYCNHAYILLIFK